ILPYFYGKDFLKLLMDRPLYIDAQGSIYEKVSIDEETLPFQFALAKDPQGNLEVKLKGISNGSFLPAYHLLFVDGVFYFLSKEQTPLLQQIDEMGMGNFHLPISKEQTETFISEVLPSLKRLGRVEIAETVQQNIIQFPLQAELYLDIKGEWLVGDLIYKYGGYRINPFEAMEATDVVILRETEKEQVIMNTIEYADFRYNGEDLYIDLSDEEHLYEFLYTYLPMFEENVSLYLTDEVRNILMEDQ